MMRGRSPIRTAEGGSEVRLIWDSKSFHRQELNLDLPLCRFEIKVRSNQNGIGHFRRQLYPEGIHIGNVFLEFDQRSAYCTFIANRNDLKTESTETRQRQIHCVPAVDLVNDAGDFA